MEDRRLILFFNKKYYIGEEFQECYVVHSKNMGTFISTRDETVRLLQKPIFELDEDNIEGYINSRGFEKVLDFDNHTISWFNGYEKDKEKILYKIGDIKSDIGSSYNRRTLTPNNGYIIHVSLTLLENKIKEGVG